MRLASVLLKLSGRSQMNRILARLATGLALAATTASVFAQVAPGQTVPEPDSWALVGVGAVVALIVRRITKR